MRPEEAFGIALECLIDDKLALRDDLFGPTIVQDFGREQADTAVMVFGVAPGKEDLAGNCGRPGSIEAVGKLHKYLPKTREEILPKNPAAKALLYTINQWDALSHFLEGGDLEIDNGATERANRDIALGRGNWTFFGSDRGGQTGLCC